jgi:hypothetical protein
MITCPVFRTSWPDTGIVKESFPAYLEVYLNIVILRVDILFFLEISSYRWPPLWSSGQSSCLQIQRSRFNSQRYQIFWEVVGLERGPLSLVSTIEELLERKCSGSGLANWDYSCRDLPRWPCDTPLSAKVGTNWTLCVHFGISTFLNHHCLQITPKTYCWFICVLQLFMLPFRFISTDNWEQIVYAWFAVQFLLLQHGATPRPAQWIWGGGGGCYKSSALYRKQQVTGPIKFIYSTYSPLRCTHLWLRCSNFFKPTKKKFLVVLQTTCQQLTQPPRCLKTFFPWGFFVVRKEVVVQWGQTRQVV